MQRSMETTTESTLWRRWAHCEAVTEMRAETWWMRCLHARPPCKVFFLWAIRGWRKLAEHLLGNSISSTTICASELSGTREWGSERHVKTFKVCCAPSADSLVRGQFGLRQVAKLALKCCSNLWRAETFLFRDVNARSRTWLWKLCGGNCLLEEN